MKVVIFCGGLGTRLREETEFKPKPMVHIGNKPILWHIMKIYAAYGFNDFILCLGYKGEVIKDYFYHYEILNNDVTLELGRRDKTCVYPCHDEIGWKVTLADTGEKSLKGARLKKIEKYIDGDTFMLTYGDGVANINLKKLLEFHQRYKKLATVTGVNLTSRFGELKINNDQVEHFVEKATITSEFINGGFFVLNKQIFSYLTEEDGCDLETGALEKVVAAGQLMVYKHTGFWASMDTFREVEFLNKLWQEKNPPWKVW